MLDLGKLVLLPQPLSLPLGHSNLLIFDAFLLALLPRDVHEFFLVGQHVLPIELMDTFQLRILDPAVEAAPHDALATTIKQRSHRQSYCFRSILALYKKLA